METTNTAMMALVLATPDLPAVSAISALALTTVSAMDTASTDPATAAPDGLEMIVLRKFALTVAQDMESA